MLINHPAAELLDKRALQVMGALDGVSTPMSGRQVARVLGSGKSRTILVLNRLTETGAVKATSRGNVTDYVVNRDHFYWNLFDLVQGFHSELFKRLAELLPRELREYDRHSAVFVFGSVARGESREASDLDVGIIVPDAEIKEQIKARVTAGSREIEAFIGNTVSPFLITWGDFSHMVLAKDPLIRSWDDDAERVTGDYVQDLRNAVIVNWVQEETEEAPDDWVQVEAKEAPDDWVQVETEEAADNYV